LIESRATRRFWQLFAVLPADIQEDARRAFALFRANPSHPGLHFKKLEGEEQIYSVRIGLGHRALGAAKKGCIVWYWIGSHADYDRLV
jgi:hypothetical protein